MLFTPLKHSNATITHADHSPLADPLALHYPWVQLLLLTSLLRYNFQFDALRSRCACPYWAPPPPQSQLQITHPHLPNDSRSFATIPSLTIRHRILLFLYRGTDGAAAASVVADGEGRPEDDHAPAKGFDCGLAMAADMNARDEGVEDEEGDAGLVAE
ncbi:hypothetical protein BU16DRAFT_557394 [Lophium mytilinum]|uniref:Uncharacterized protein n=1 Tax=Lophium mytilinum TaxID=390894 RepID=A0A6A6R525_9PEZI|nr:hypothetical protein BU16DRAFT_557394 [Lophium mytilinum]